MIQAREGALAAARAATGAIGAGSVAARIVALAGDVARWGEARKLANTTGGAAAVAIGASPCAGIPLAIDVARRAPALEGTMAVIAARTVAVGADAAAVVVVADAIDMAGWGGAVEVARFARVADTVPTVAAVIIIIAAACVQDGGSAQQKQGEGREGNTRSREHWSERRMDRRRAQGSSARSSSHCVRTACFDCTEC